MADEKDLQQQVTEMQAAITKQNETISGLASSHASLQKENAALNKKLNDLQGVKENPKQAPKPELPKDTFQVGEQTFKFVVAQFKFKGNVITAKDALTDSVILEALVKGKSGVIKEVE